MEIRMVESKALVLDGDEIEKLKICLEWFKASDFVVAVNVVKLGEAQKFAGYMLKKLTEGG